MLSYLFPGKDVLNFENKVPGGIPVLDSVITSYRVPYYPATKNRYVSR